jgi:hypothetical protein
VYERIMRDANSDGTAFPYFVTGLGGGGRYDFGSPIAGSTVRYSANYGTMLVQASDTSITFEFVSVAGGGTLIDSYTVDLPTAASLLADGNDVLTSKISNSPLNDLSDNDQLNGLAGNDTLVGSTGDDIFVFAPGSGQDLIGDFTPGQGTLDRINLTAFGFGNFANVISRATNSGANILLDLGTGDRITLKGIQVNQLHQDDFIL